MDSGYFCTLPWAGISTITGARALCPFGAHETGGGPSCKLEFAGYFAAMILGVFEPDLPEPPGIDVTVAHPARMYDYYLGSKVDVLHTP